MPGDVVLRLNDGYDDTSPDLHAKVVELQALLVSNGSEIDQDGLFGPGTEECVENFQRTHTLTADGVVGPMTWNALRGAAPVSFPTSFAGDDPGMISQETVARTYRQAVTSASRNSQVPECVIAGIASRESGWGLSSAMRPRGPSGTGDFGPRAPRLPQRPDKLPPDGGGFGRGLMQIDYDSHPFARQGNWRDPASNIAYGATVLASTRLYLIGKTALMGLDLWRGALAGYNCGAGNVVRAYQKGLDLDYYTSGRNYGRDTLSRAGWFAAHGWT